MEPKYIVAIVALCVFCVLFVIFFIMLSYRRKTEAKLQAWLHEVYSDKNLIKLDYDTVSLDEKGQSVIDTDILPAKQEENEEQLKIEEVFIKKDIEGIEEITGNYIPD